MKFHRPVRTFCKQDFSCQDTYHRFDHHDDGDPDGDGAAASFFNRQRCRLSPFCRLQARCGVLLNPSLRVRNRRNRFRPPSPPPMSLHDLYSHHKSSELIFIVIIHYQMVYRERYARERCVLEGYKVYVTPFSCSSSSIYTNYVPHSTQTCSQLLM